MFDWEGCPLSLFDQYMEVGEITLTAPAEGVRCVEVWVGSAFAKGHSRPQCASIRRRPIYGVLKQIQKLSAGDNTVLLFMCDDTDDNGNDTENQSCAIYLLLQALKQQKPMPVALFTRKSMAQILARSQGDFHKESDRAEYAGLFALPDILITEQANRYSSPAEGKCHLKPGADLSSLDWLL